MKTAVCLQVRLDSTRLPGKALLTIENLTLIEHAMRALVNIDADLFLLLTTEECEKELKPLAERWGFSLFSGPKEDVLSRFVLAARNFGVTTLIRATGDNPLVSAEMANEVLKEHKAGDFDYTNWTDAPLGTGIEVVETSALFQAETDTEKPYDREHVTPWIYNNPDRFKLNIHQVPEKYFLKCKVSVDTKEDLEAMREIFSRLYKGVPIEIEELIAYLKGWLLIPSTKEGNGMGHLKRMVTLAEHLGSTACIYIDPAHRERVSPAVPSVLSERVLSEIGDPRSYGAIVIDGKETDLSFYRNYLEGGNVIGIDEGGAVRELLPYAVDILPLPERFSRPNFSSLSFLGLPAPVARPHKDKVLISFGGEDPAGLTAQLCREILKSDAELVNSLTVVLGPLYRGDRPDSKFEIIESPDNLVDLISSCRGILCSYGLTAYEAVNQDIPVLMVNPGDWHEELAELEGFPSAGVGSENVMWERVMAFIRKPDDFPPPRKDFSGPGLAEYLSGLANPGRSCPLCGSSESTVEARFPERTYRRCSRCGIIYLLNYKKEKISYSSEYFFEQYRNQYGKTYLDDFPHIMKMGEERLRTASKWLAPGSAVLDAGCAYGPFLKQAETMGYQPFGTDISAAAGSYVERELGYPVEICRFEDFTIPDQWGIESFDLLTMWYVIEHFRDLKSVLDKINHLLKKGGIFAFSTPNGEGISSKKDHIQFLADSPEDHYTIWEPGKSADILERYGFILEKIRVTGHHPERFPGIFAKSPVGRKLNLLYSRMRGLGDTFEIYARKVRDI